MKRKSASAELRRPSVSASVKARSARGITAAKKAAGSNSRTRRQPVATAAGVAASPVERILAEAKKAGVSVGRPTEYCEAMCQGVIAHARLTGLSLAAFADAVDVDRATLTRWGQKHPEFRTAMSRAKAARAKRLEVEVMKLNSGPAISARLLALKNCAEDDWREQQDHRFGGLPGAPPIGTAAVDLSRLTSQQVYDFVLNGAPLPDAALAKPSVSNGDSDGA